MLTGIHSCHLSTGFLLFHYGQISPGQSPLKPVAKVLLFIQGSVHSESLQGKREGWDERHSLPLTLWISSVCPFFIAGLSASPWVQAGHEF